MDNRIDYEVESPSVEDKGGSGGNTVNSSKTSKVDKSFNYCALLIIVSVAIAFLFFMLIVYR